MSKIKTAKSLVNLFRYRAGTINDHLNLKMPQSKKTDIALVFGSRQASAEVAEAASSLYHMGSFEKIAISGGRGLQPAYSRQMRAWIKKDNSFTAQMMQDMFSPRNESDFIEKYLINSGIPKESIVWQEDSSQNISETIEKSIHVLKRVNSATFIALAPLAARTLYTARNHSELDHLDITVHQVMPSGLEWESWHKNSFNRLAFGKIMAGEMAKIDPDHPDTYIGSQCKLINIEEERARAARLPDAGRPKLTLVLDRTAE